MHEQPAQSGATHLESGLDFKPTVVNAMRPAGNEAVDRKTTDSPPPAGGTQTPRITHYEQPDFEVYEGPEVKMPADDDTSWRTLPVFSALVKERAAEPERFPQPNPLSPHVQTVPTPPEKPSLAHPAWERQPQHGYFPETLRLLSPGDREGRLAAWHMAVEEDRARRNANGSTGDIAQLPRRIPRESGRDWFHPPQKLNQTPFEG